MLANTAFLRRQSFSTFPNADMHSTLMVLCIRRPKVKDKAFKRLPDGGPEADKLHST